MAKQDSIPDIEEWRDVPDWPYAVSSWGNVKKTKTSTRLKNGNSVKKTRTARGYIVVAFSDFPRKKQMKVHQLVCSAFHGPKPTKEHVVAHWDGDKTNNRAENVRWATSAENTKDAHRLGEIRRGTTHGRSKIGEEDVILIRDMFDSGIEEREIQNRFPFLTRRQIGRIYRREQWKCVTEQRRPVEESVAQQQEHR